MASLKQATLIREGKTKKVYRLPDGTIALEFKDDVTGANGIIDPGANTIGGQILGKGAIGIRFATYFFKMLAAKHYPTHFIDSDLDHKVMLVRPVHMFGQGLECICRFFAEGSAIRRFGLYAEKGDALNPPVVEVTLKDDERGDPPCNASWAESLKLCNRYEFQTIERLTLDIATLVGIEMYRRKLTLIDIKFEFARDANTGEVILIDEISTDCWRVRDWDGKDVDIQTLSKIFFEEEAPHV